MRLTAERGTLLIILLAAALLRAAYLLQIEHNVDQAYPIWQALQTLDHGIFPLAGQGTSVLFANPALTGYLFIPVVGLTRSALGAYMFTITLNTLGVFLAYRAVKTALGTIPALVTAALLAVNPWVIEYSRTTWVQSLLPFFACALAWLLWPVLLGKSRHPARRLLSGLVLLTLFTQTYLLSFAMLAPVVLLLLLFRRRVPRSALVTGAALFALALGLYGIGLLREWDTVQQKLSSFTGAQASFSTTAWEHALRLISGADYAAARGQNAPLNDWQTRQNLSQIAHITVLAALVGGIGLAAAALAVKAQSRSGRFVATPALLPARDAALILLVWFALPVVLMLRVGQAVHPFYQLLGLPAGSALAAWGLCAALRPQTRRGAAMLIALVVPFAVLMAVNSVRYAQETQASPGAHQLYALPLQWGLRLGQVINAQLPPGGIVFAPVEDWVLNSFAGRSFLGLRDNRAPTLTIIPQQGGLYIVAQTPENIPAAPPETLAVTTLTLPDNVQVRVNRLPRADAITPENPLNVPSQQGITLIGYALQAQESAGQGLFMLLTYWRIDTRAPEIDRRLFAPFAHLFDNDGSRVLVVDGQPLPGFAWHVGDVHIHRMIFVAPDDALTIVVGQYDAGNNANVIFYLPDGTTNATVTLPEALP